MGKTIRLNALDMMCMGAAPGNWSHPRDRSQGYKRLEYWTGLARTLERGLFDSLFIADIYGVYDVYGGNADAAFTHAVESPVCDPMLVVPAMALVTDHLGFGVTGTLTYEPAFSFARRASTLDHLTRGRFAWNIVTGYLESAAKGFGLKSQLSHDERYDFGDEYLALLYKLWEGSWEDDAVRYDKAAGVFADAAKVHEIHHKGRYLEAQAYHLCEPSPQRTPVLFQAGASARGRAFAARHAECVFTAGLTRATTAKTVADLRERARGHGRDPNDLIIYNGLALVVGRSDAEARDKLADYRAHTDIARTLTLFSGYIGIDLSGYDLDAPLRYFESNAIRSFVENFTVADPDVEWTLREIGKFLGVGGFSPIEVGAPDTLADAMQRWMDDTDIDGFNLMYTVTPDDMTDVVDLLVPELQRRGLYATAYAPGTLREKLYGAGHRRVLPTHPAAAYRV